MTDPDMIVERFSASTYTFSTDHRFVPRDDYQHEASELVAILAAEEPAGALHHLAQFFTTSVNYTIGDVWEHTTRLHAAGRPVAIEHVPAGQRPPQWPSPDPDDRPEERTDLEALDLRLTDLVAVIGSGDRQPDGSINIVSREEYATDGQRVIDAIWGTRTDPNVHRMMRFLCWTVDLAAYDTAITISSALQHSDPPPAESTP